MELVPVGDDATTAAAHRLGGEYLSWVAGMAAEHHGLVFDTEAMLASDIGDHSKFYAPHGRFYLLRDAQVVLLADARAIGCDVVRLESLKSLASAHALYRSAGFVEVAPDDDNGLCYYQSEAALDAYRSNAEFMAMCLR